MANSKKNTRTYSQMSEELSDLLEWFESSSLDVDEAIKKYEQAERLLDEMENYLKTAQNKIHKISIKKS